MLEKAGEKQTVIPLRSFSDYFLENMATNGNHWQQLQITSACDARCSFCSNDQNSFETARARFRDIKEIEKVLFAMPPHNDSIILNESLPGRISEGEALIHPKLIDILALIRRKFNNVIATTTSGSRLTPELIEKMAAFNPIEVTMSVPSVNEKHWTEIFKLKPQHYQNAMNSIYLMQKYGISVRANITPLPSQVGYHDIENTISFLARNNIKYLYVFAPGYTQYTAPKDVENMIYDKAEMSLFLQQMSHKYKIEIDWPLDPNRTLEIDYGLFSKIARSLYRANIAHSYWLTSEAAYDRIVDVGKSIVKNIPHEIRFIKVENRAYGGNIEAMGLWMVSDVREAIQENGLQNENIILPLKFVDKYGFDLNGENINDYVKVANNHFHLIKDF